MWKLALWTRKGGSGKSTLAASLGVIAAAERKRIAIVDADPQGSISSWSHRREAETPFVAAASFLNLPNALRAAESDGYAGVIVDLPGTLGKDEARALKLVDVVLVPMRPTPFDLVATRTSLAVAASAGVRAIVVLTQLRPRAREAVEARELLASEGAIVVPTEVGFRAAFPAAIAGGFGVTEYEPKGRAAAEITALFADVRKALRRG
jgi:chromosome partitioning protein